MNPMLGGISKAFLEGGKDLFALVDYLGRKEMEDKKYGLEQQRLQNTQQYQQGLLQHMSRQDELANKNYNLSRLRAETQSDLAEQRREEMAMNAGWQQRKTDADIEYTNKKMALLDAQIEAIKNKKYNQSSGKSYSLADIKSGFSMASTRLKNFLNAYARTLNIGNNIISSINAYAESGNPEGINDVLSALKQSKFESLPKDKQDKFKQLLADVDLWYDRYKNTIINTGNNQNVPQGTKWSDILK